jgi:hypothetical protein
MAVLTPEEHDAMVQKVWDNSREKLEEVIESTIFEELRMGMSSRTRHIVSKEIDKLIQPLIEAKKQELQEGAEKALNRIFNRLASGMMVRMESLVYSHSEFSFQKAGEALARGLRDALAAALKELKNEIQSDLQNAGRPGSDS